MKKLRNCVGLNGRVWLVALLSSAILFTACSKDDDNDDGFDYGQIMPKGVKPTWGPTLTAQMQTVIEALDTLAPIPIFELTPAQARQQPGAADAFLRVMTNYRIMMPVPKVDTVGKQIPVEGGSIHARVYTPTSGKSTYPVIVYYHGGGWVVATIDTYNSSAQALAEKTDAIVVSVEYRKGPEFKFPTAHNDAYTAYEWVLENASTFKGDSSRVAVAGESAGGNLAITVGIMARDNGISLPVHALAVYPVADNDLQTASKIQYAMAKPLSTPALPWFLGHYLNNLGESADQRISLVDADLTDLPATTIIAAEIDPLQTEGKTLSDRLNAAGVSVKYQLYTGVTHEFFGMTGVIPEAGDAQDLAAAELKTAFE